MVNQQQMHYDRHGGWQPVKARKIDVLEFIYGREEVTSHDLMEEFEYTYSSARCRLCQLRKEGGIQFSLKDDYNDERKTFFCPSCNAKFKLEPIVCRYLAIKLPDEMLQFEN